MLLSKRGEFFSLYDKKNFYFLYTITGEGGARGSADGGWGWHSNSEVQTSFCKAQRRLKSNQNCSQGDHFDFKIDREVRPKRGLEPMPPFWLGGLKPRSVRKPSVTEIKFYYSRQASGCSEESPNHQPRGFSVPDLTLSDRVYIIQNGRRLIYKERKIWCEGSLW